MAKMSSVSHRYQWVGHQSLQCGITTVILRGMKTAISIPDPIFEQAEEAARELRMSRSELYTTALREFLTEKDSTRVTERLNEVYEAESSTLDPVLMLLQATALPVEEW